MPDCLHPLGRLRASVTFPQRFVQCQICNEVFELSGVLEYDRPGLADRVMRLAKCLNGESPQDGLPLAQFVTAGTVLATKQGRVVADPQPEDWEK